MIIKPHISGVVFVYAELFVGFKYRFCTLQVFLINEINLFMFISVK